MFRQCLKIIKKENVFIGIIFCFSCFLFLANLGNHFLWQDEAQTACISKTVLKSGIPLGHDGKNSFSQVSGAEFGRDLVWKWHPWFPFYLLAGFFKLFGTNTFVARLPFALFGIASVILIYFFTKSLYNNKRIALIATVLLFTSVPFLILSRQCRYYSLTAFFSLATLYCYYGVTKKRKHASILFIISSTLLFHSFYVYSVPLLLTIFVHSILFCRNSIRKVLLLLIGVCVINLPWIIWFTGIKYSNLSSGWEGPLGILKFFNDKIEESLFPRASILVILIICAVNWIRNKRYLSIDAVLWKGNLLLLFFILFNLVTLTLSSSVPYFRYLSPMVPVFCIIVAVIINSAMDINIIFGIVLLSAMVLSNNILDYFYEITHDYNGPIEGIVKHLNKHANENDLVAITYGDMPLKFYTNLRVLGGLTGENLEPARKTEWVIIRKSSISGKLTGVTKWLIKNIPWSNYQKKQIDYPDCRYENREEPREHRFRTAMDKDKVVIYQKLDE